MSNMLDIVKPDLLNLSIDEAVIEYIVGIVEGEDIDGEDKFESIEGYLLEFTDSPTDEIINNWLKIFETVKKERDAKEEEIRRAEAEMIREMELLKLKQKVQNEEPKKSPKKVLTEEELARKKQLLAQYDYEVIEIEGEETPKVVKPVRGPPPKPSPDELFANQNAQLVEEKERMKRDMARKQHTEKVQKDKINLDKQRQEKEKKKSTQKQEKRRM